MIVAEHIIRDIVATIPEIRINDEVSRKPSFHWGDENELDRYIKKNRDTAYPLIWLLPSDDIFRTKGSNYEYLEKRCEFVLCTREVRQELFNDQRYILSYDVVLNPLLEYLITGLTKSNVGEQIGNQFTSFKSPNYSAESDANGTIDIWDAIKLDITIKFKDTCLKTIYYGN